MRAEIDQDLLQSMMTPKVKTPWEKEKGLPETEEPLATCKLTAENLKKHEQMIKTKED